MKFLKILSVSILLSGCSSYTINNDNNIPVQSYSDDNLYVPNYVFNADYQDSLNTNTLEDNLKLLKAFNNDSDFIQFINNNKDVDSKYYSYFYNYNLLVNKIKEQESKKNKETVKEFITQENINKTSIELKNEINKDINEINNNIVEKKLILEKEKKELEDKEKERLEKEKQEAKIKEKERLEKEKQEALKKKKDLYKKNYYIIKENIDNHFLILKAHCHEEDAYLIPEDNDTFKEYILNYSTEKTIYKNDIDFSNYVYSFYKKDIDLCFHIFENIAN